VLLRGAPKGLGNLDTCPAVLTVTGEGVLIPTDAGADVRGVCCLADVTTVGVTIAVGVEAADLKLVDATVGVMNLCRALTAAVADGVPALTAEVPGTDVLAGINLCAAAVTEPGAAGRIPREGIEGRGAPGLDDRGIRACAEVPTTLDVLILAPVEVEATGDAVVLGRRDSGDASLCPDAAVTLGLLALMPVGVEALGPAAANVVGVLDLCVPNGAANLCADVLATTGAVGLGAVVLGPVALVLGQVVEVAVLGPVPGVPVLGQVVEEAVLGPVAGVPVRGAVVAVKLLGPDDGVLALGPVAGALLPVPAGENGYLDPVITELDVVVPWP